MVKSKLLLSLLCTLFTSLLFSQSDSLNQRPKLIHAEPLYIDLIRDLGARKGEKEWNIGLGIVDHKHSDRYEALIEYEWAPIDRLGLEVELPFSITSSNSSENSSGLNSIKLAAQWTFLVNEKYETSMALGYINEFELSDLQNFGHPLIKSNVYNPFFVVAKRWGQNFHTLLYTGPKFEHNFKEKRNQTHWNINSNVHYMIPGTRNFVGLELNKSWQNGEFEMIARPQMRLAISNQTMLGIVTGLPIQSEHEKMSALLRLIWEPPHH